MASENDTTDQTTPATDVAEGAAASAPEKPKRRRATKKASAPEPVDPGTEGAPAGTDADEAGAADGSEAPEAPEAPVKKATRKRAAKKTTTKKAAKGAAPADSQDAALAPTADEPAPADLGATEADPTEATADDEEEDGAAPAVPTFGLVFQPPQPVTRPRRRATSPVQAPVERPAEELEAEAEAASATPAADDSDAAPAVGTPRRSRRSRAQAVTEESAEAADEAGDDSSSDDTQPESDADAGSRRRRSRGGRGRRGRSGGDDDGRDPRDARGTRDSDDEGDDSSSDDAPRTGPSDQDDASDSGSSRRRRRRRRGGSGDGEGDDPPGTVTRVREPRSPRDEPTAVKGSTRLEAKKQRRREGREAGRRRTIITEAEFLARRESVERVMVVRGRGDRTQIGVLEDGVLVEHYVSRETTASMAGNVYLGRVQNVLPSMEAAFVDIGKGRNAVLYAGEVNWDAAGLEGGNSRRIENALSSGDTVLVQVTKDPIGHKGARLTSQISLPGRYLVYVPEGQMTGISRKLPDTERARLKAILKEVVPDHAGVIVRTAAEGASEEELRADVDRLTKAWEKIAKKAESAKAKKAGSGGAPALLHGEPDLTVRVIRDVFTEDFTSLVVSGDKAWNDVSEYIEDVAPDLASRVTRWTSEDDVFAAHRIDESIAKAMDRKVWLPSGGSLVIDRTEAMTVVDVNTGKFVGSGGNLEETVTKNNLEAAEEIVRQLRLRDIGGIIVIDFIDMVLEANRDLVVRRLLECLGRDRTKHQVAEVTSLGLVQMTRKRVGSGLIEVFSETCEHCAGRGIVVHSEPIDRGGAGQDQGSSARSGRGRGGRSGSGSGSSGSSGSGSSSAGGSAAAERAEEHKVHSGPSAAQIAAAAHAAALRKSDGGHHDEDLAGETGGDVAVEPVEDAPVTTDAPAAEIVEAPDVADVAEPVEDVRSAEAPSTQPEVAPEPVAVVEEEPVAPAPRGRRRRGRVVAPAGPPRSGAGEGGAQPGSE
ncbi:Rne/Rng family ribonuclease [Oryzobacter terrae]|uniref:Rne/Rng family ribonuclease n=1 Tax=Oryzobacter terrae TaxID=1620385 RepID=UPI003671F181